MKKLFVYALLLVAPIVIAEESHQFQKIKEEYSRHQTILKEHGLSPYDCKSWMFNQVIKNIDARTWNTKYKEEYSEKEAALQAIDLLPADWQRQTDCEKAQDELRGFVNKVYDDAEILEKRQETGRYFLF